MAFDDWIAIPFLDLGDGLFQIGGDIFCTYPLLSYKNAETETSGVAIYKYAPYSITVSYVIDGSERKNAHWMRTYKEAGG
jgi:hypothetical protein|nr:MAG TPA: hypothetical protein [Caudoviricetes sp.]